MRTIYFDMDGTIANFYGVENWLEYLVNRDTTPYKEAKPLINMNSLARMLNNLQKKGFEIGIISWLAKNSSVEYDKAVTDVKIKWLKTHLKSVHFNEIIIVPYGTPKEGFATENDILFDDEKPNRDNWIGIAYDEKNIINILKKVDR